MMDLLRVSSSTLMNSVVQLIESSSRGADVVDMVKHRSGLGSEMLGWLDWPEKALSSDWLDELIVQARRLSACCEYVLCLGIGGSLLGTKALIDALGSSVPSHNHRKLYFAGHNLDEDYLGELLTMFEGKSFGIIVISKSGQTTETAIAFRLFRKLLVKNIGEGLARERIIAITDPEQGTLQRMSREKGYCTFDIPHNIGGRYSVLTPVGLLPLAVVGHDVKGLLKGAKAMADHIDQSSLTDNPALLYAMMRYQLYSTGKSIELLANYTSRMHYIGKWWEQLFAESEGKQHKGLFPMSLRYSTDLHSIGQWVQDGPRIAFETVLTAKSMRSHVVIPSSRNDMDGLNYLAGKRMSHVSRMAHLGTSLAHNDGDVPVICIELKEINEQALGALIYFFQMAVTYSGYLLGVNPFDQPGVEDYKRNMFALLDRPGYEDESILIKRRIEQGF